MADDETADETIDIEDPEEAETTGGETTGVEPTTETSTPEDDPKKQATDIDTDEEYDEINPVDLNFSPIDLVTSIYNNRYYWSIFKSTVVFCIALKMARECKMLKIPMKEYKPFNRCNHFF